MEDKPCRKFKVDETEIKPSAARVVAGQGQECLRSLARRGGENRM